MKILVFGAGVIGTTYAWQMWEAGYDVSLLVRKQRLVRYKNSGVSISCTDVRSREKEYKKTVFRPRTIDRLDPSDGFDLIIVAVKNFQLNDTVPYLSRFSGNAHILFLGNLWKEFDLIEKHFPKGRCFFGYPAMVLGGQTINGINCYLFGNSNTCLGEPGGKKTSRLTELSEILEKSGLQPKVINPIEPWIRGQFLWHTVAMGPVIKAGSFRLFAENNKLIAQSVKGIKEGLNICKKAGIKAEAPFPFWMLSLPSFVAVPLLKKSFNLTLQAAFEARLKHGFEELKGAFLQLLNMSKESGVNAPYLSSFEKYLPEGEKKYLQQGGI